MLFLQDQSRNQTAAGHLLPLQLMAATLKTFLYASRCFNQGGGCTSSRPSHPSTRPVTTSCLLLQSHHLSCCCFVSNQAVFAAPAVTPPKLDQVLLFLLDHAFIHNLSSLQDLKLLDIV
ncbi:hypothetical protein LR48_Vigan642s000100 [Vigna angularis]|uniref:Uncharacterized protein n=1 Tax=Phaseolus angularis TaxID=3914 RepID=A0A0L9TFT4_PHAAN|nr:hypothetical protein LR48_Vigan642s000100 [Vigna angularis]